jgi:hypothetical protein
MTPTIITPANIHDFRTGAITGCQVHPKLILIVGYFISIAGRCMMTSGYRPDDPGVHGVLPLRGIDFRAWDQVDPERLAAAINAQFIYDPTRPELKVCLYHKNRNAPGMHLHFQAHEYTILA